MKKLLRFVPVVARVLLGLLFTVTGLNGFLNFLPQPDPGAMPEGAMAFAGALQSSGYMFPMIMGTQLLCGVLLVTGLFVPLALVLLAPVVVNIVAFHVFLAPTGTGIAIAVLVAEVYLVWAYRKAYGPMLRMRVKPGA